MRDPEKVASGILIKIKSGKKPSEDKTDEAGKSEGADGLDDVVDEMIQAFESKDRDLLKDALKSFKRQCAAGYEKEDEEE